MWVAKYADQRIIGSDYQDLLFNENLCHRYMYTKVPAATSCRCDARVCKHAHCFCIIYNCNVNVRIVQWDVDISLSLGKWNGDFLH